MSIEQDIFLEVKKVLEENATLKNYIEEVYDGIRDTDDNFVNDTVKNYIVLEPLSCEETNPAGAEFYNSAQGVPKQLTFVIGILGVITASGKKNYSYVTGWGKNKGILDLDEDIKNALDNSDTVQGLADGGINVSTNSFIFEDFPRRRVDISITITRNFRKGAR